MELSPPPLPPKTEPSAPTAPPPASFAHVLRKHWVGFALVLGALLIGGAFLYLWLASRNARSQQEPVAAASSNIEAAIPQVQTGPVATASPSAQLEAQRRAEQTAQNAPPPPSNEDLPKLFVADTAGATAYNKRKQAAKATTAAPIAPAPKVETDTVETTVRDPATGAYRAETLVVPRRRVAAASRSSKTGARAPALPAYDTDGTPFETDPSILAMLGSAPPETRVAYERMTGKRYRDPAQLAQAIANSTATTKASAVSDGFNTIKLGNASRMMAASAQRQAAAAQPQPDVFFKCSIHGEQRVRSNSIVLLRLQEPAVIGGVTFPKNTVFAGVANVETNRVTLTVDRLGAYQVAAQLFDYNYMPGITIDPEKRIAKDANQGYQTIQQQSTQELGMAIDRSASAANSLTGVGGRVAASVLSRPKTKTKLRDVLLPDGYPLLITTAAAGQMGLEANAGR